MTTLKEAAAAVIAAREDVEAAQIAYSKGASCDAVNNANRKLADAHDRLYEVKSGRVRDSR